MNLVCHKPLKPIRVLLVNPIGKTFAMIAVKIMRGLNFGVEQLVDLILLVYSNDVHHAERLKWEIIGCGFPCNNSITITSDIPKLTDADVFIFATSLPNSHNLDFDNVDNADVFDSFYLLMTVAKNLEWPEPEPPVEENIFRKKKVMPETKRLRPIIIADGLVALSILKNYSKNLPNDIFFCPSPVVPVARSVLGEHLKVLTTDINRMYVWGANFDVFHVEVATPIYVGEKTSHRVKCEWAKMANNEFEMLDIDFTQFNAAWLKKDFINKIGAMISFHPHGFIYKCSMICKTLQSIWNTRIHSDKLTHRFNVGIISDGSQETYKGLPYFLPVIFKGESYSVDDFWADDVHVKQEIKRINKVVLAHHKKLMSFCKKFYYENVIKKEFIPLPIDDSTEGATEALTETGTEADT